MEPVKRHTVLHSWARAGAAWLAKKDLVLLVSVAGLVLLLWGFFFLANEVKGGDTTTFDEKIVRSFRHATDLSDPFGPEWLEESVRDITALGSPLVLGLLTAFVGGFLVMRRQYHALIFLLVAVAGGGLLNLALKSLFSRPRPDMVPHLMSAGSTSFPSGHSMLAAVCYLTLGAVLARLVEGQRLRIYFISVALCLAFAVGFSRVYLGVHYPTDVFAGWLVGLVWAIACWLVARYLQIRGQVEKAK